MAVLRYDDPDLPSRLESAIHDFWDRSGTVAKPLREAAQQQVRLSREAYTAFFDRVDAATARRPRCQPAALGAKPLADHA